MKTQTNIIATAEVLLISPTVLFLTSLFVRNLQPVQYEPARTAQRIVDWYAARPHIGLWEFMIGLPLVVLVTGAATLLRNWTREAELRETARTMLSIVKCNWPTLLIATATVAAGSALGIVALHLLTD
jgi:hypothetical protein